MQGAEKSNYKRRYVSTRESTAYVLFDSSKNFHIEEYETRFVINVLKLDLNLNTIVSLLNGIWDVINDSFLGAMIDKTNTRYGKFKPYLAAYVFPGTFAICLFWLAPLFLTGKPAVTMALGWLGILMLREVFRTVRGIAETGLLSTLTPNPDDRVRLYTSAEVISSIWESLPQIAMGILIDLINNKVIDMPLQTAYISMGVGTSICMGLLGLFFAIYAKERVAQSLEKHSYREGVRTILNNKPMLLIMLTEFLGGFSTTTWEHNYYIDVLGSSTLRNLVTIPGVPLSFLSYTYINQIRHHFSTKALWIFGKHLRDVATMVIFAVGSIGGKGPNGLYRSVPVMAALLMGRDILYKGTLSINKIIPKEIITDALDYCEWKNGFRAEGVLLSTKSMLTKVVNNLISSLTTALMQRGGYSLNAGFGEQSDSTKYYLFMMCTLIPAAFSLIGLIPKLFYDLTGEKRERMYEELSEMRMRKNQEYALMEAEISKQEEGVN